MALYGRVLTEKKRHYFKLTDSNRNGFVTKSDFDELASHLINVSHAQGGKADKIRAIFNEIWTGTYEPLATDGKLDFDHYIAAVKKKALKGDRTSFTEDAYHEFFDLFDFDGDGFINLEEFKLFHKAYKIHPLDSEPVFNILDKDQDGRISRKEFIDAGVDFHQCEVETPAMHMYGFLYLSGK